MTKKEIRLVIKSMKEGDKQQIMGYNVSKEGLTVFIIEGIGRYNTSKKVIDFFIKKVYNSK